MLSLIVGLFCAIPHPIIYTIYNIGYTVPSFAYISWRCGGVRIPFSIPRWLRKRGKERVKRGAESRRRSDPGAYG